MDETIIHSQRGISLFASTYSEFHWTIQVLTVSHAQNSMSIQTNRICTPRVNPNINCELWMIMMCHCGFLNYNKCTTLLEDVDNGGGSACVWLSRLLRGKELTCQYNAGDTKMRVQSLGQGGHLEEEMAMHCSILPHRQRRPVGYSPWSCKESDLTATEHACLHVCGQKLYRISLYLLLLLL